MNRDIALQPPPARLLHGEYWNADAAGRVTLIAYECTSCGTSYLPKVAACVTCRGSEFSRRTLSEQGSLYSYTIVRNAGGVWPAIYAIGYVDFPERVRVCGHLRETREDQLKPDMPVTIEQAQLYEDSDGTPVVCFRFRCATGSTS